MGFNVELASLASKVRGDVRLCCCVISDRVYENLLFFPVYEVNKNVRWANVYDLDEDFPELVEYVNMIGDGDDVGSVLCDVEKGQLGHVEVWAGRVAPAAIVAGESGVRRVEVGGHDDMEPGRHHRGSSLHRSS
ncbi:hypothetical protein ZIOFF_063034 [Zingiber officinale]|uniref:Uncharacterized protein n=1 Tax=Zingiber officinale TaxID=94328 RepID=A0A8J5F634_ZINOF|nr:hypothetical protein ZIOFF_063034 [Zingiber officinale]